MRLGIALLLVLGCSNVPALGTAPAPEPAPAPAPSASPEGRPHANRPSRRIQHDSVAKVVELGFEGTPRRYRVIAPDNYSADREWPAILAFHGGGPGNTGEKMEPNWVDQGGRGVFLVFPDGLNGNWVAPAEAGSPGERDPLRDVRFAEAVVSDLREKYRIDERKVFATGFSNGAMLVWAIACNRPQAFAGFATVGAGMTVKTLESCRPGIERPLMHIQGTAESGFDGKVVTEFGIHIAGAEASVGHLASAGGCDPTPRRQTVAPECASAGAVERKSFGGCRGQGRIEFNAINGGRHQWPGKLRDTCPSMDASQEILRFFELLPR